MKALKHLIVLALVTALVIISALLDKLTESK